MQPRALTFLSYAVNGRGVGHLTRQVAIQKWLRRLCAVLGIEGRHWFLTTSEADQIATAEGFAAFKLPSKTAAVDAGLGKPRYLGLAKQWVWHSIGLIRPDVLLVDTFPEGSFHELPSALDLAKHRALILRPVKEEFARDPAFRASVELYDRVFTPTSGVFDDDELDPLASLNDLGWFDTVGPVFLTEPFEREPRDAARRALGAPDDRTVLLVTGGGGGDDTVPGLFERVRAVARARDDVHVVYGAGPLYRGPPLRGPDETWLEAPGLARLLNGVDLAVSACGFNTAHELMSAATPTLFLPQPKIADDQAARAERFARAGAAQVGTRDGLEAELIALLDDAAQRDALAARARALEVTSAARDIAAKLLSNFVDAGRVDQALELITPRALSSVHSLHALADISHALGDLVRPDLEVAADLLDAATGAGFPLERLPRLCTLLTRRVPGDPAAVAALVTRLLEHPLVFGQSATLISLVQLLTAAKGSTAADVERELLSTFDACLASGRGLGDLVRVIAEEPETERPVTGDFLDPIRTRIRGAAE
jgi:predicted glycosyltransferase